MKSKKKGSIVYKSDPEDNATELEAFLFGAKADPSSLFDQRHDEESIADMLRKARCWRRWRLMHPCHLLFCI